MRTINILQNTDWEHLGVVEDHLEGRNIRFRYIRPAHNVTWQKAMQASSDGLIVLGAAPYGTVEPPLVPGLEAKVQVIHRYLNQDLPVIGFGTGAQMLALAAGHEVIERPMTVAIETAYRVDDQALNGFLPSEYPVVTFMRDMYCLPENAEVLAQTKSGLPALFRIFGNCLGFIGHPGIKSAIIEDSLVQYPEYTDYDVSQLSDIRLRQNDVADSLISIMTGLIQITGWMDG